MENRPLVSIIVPAYNSEKTIGQCLNSLLNLDYDPNKYEIIIIDDGSSDSTFRIAKAFSLNRPQKVKLYRMKCTKGPSYCMNFGVKKAKSKWIAIFDADSTAPKNWLKKAVKNFKDGDIIGGRFITRPINDFEKAVYSLENFPTKEIRFNNKNYREPCLAGTNFFFKKDIFEKIGGFDERIRAGYDRLFQCLALKNGYVIKYIPNLFVYHPSSRSFREYIRRVENFHRWRLLASKKCKMLAKSYEGIIPLLIGLFLFSLIFVLKFGATNFLLLISFLAILTFVAKLTILLLTKGLPLKTGLVATSLYFVSKFIGIKNYILRRKPQRYWKQ